MKKKLINFFIICCALLVGLIASELFLRFINSTGTNYDIEMWRYSKELKKISTNEILGHEHIKSHQATLQNVLIRTNSLGMRGNEPKTNFERRILFLGSSITMGWGVDEDDVFTNILQRKFKDDGYEVDILNAGIGNYNTERYVENFLTNLYQTEPDDIVIHYFLNDIEILTHNSGNIFTRNFHIGVAIWKTYNQLFGNINQIKLEEYYKDLYQDNSESFLRMKMALKKLVSYSNQNNINLYLSITPDIHNLEEYPFIDIHKKMELISKEFNIPFINYFDSFQRITTKNLWNLENDPHPNKIGHKIMAEQIYPYLIESYNK